MQGQRAAKYRREHQNMQKAQDENQDNRSMQRSEEILKPMLLAKSPPSVLRTLTARDEIIRGNTQRQQVSWNRFYLSCLYTSSIHVYANRHKTNQRMHVFLRKDKSAKPKQTAPILAISIDSRICTPIGF
ncbi:hypothetical protein G9A89_001095 [Geosiphon pyriformis]|nr:hypothetical protein G9A89_001095 [Geosiphon pyriformis]